jgi:hypothetical protein
VASLRREVFGLARCVPTKRLWKLGEDVEHKRARMFVGRVIGGTAVVIICNSGEARNANPGGAQSERPKKRRQSGVVDIDGSLRPEVH